MNSRIRSVTLDHTVMKTLREENDALREKIAYLERALIPALALPMEIEKQRLTAYERRIFLCLWKLPAGEIATRARLEACLYFDKPDYNSSLHVIMQRLRAKLLPTKWKLVTHHGSGYSLITPEPGFTEPSTETIPPPWWISGGDGEEGER